MSTHTLPAISFVPAPGVVWKYFTEAWAVFTGFLGPLNVTSTSPSFMESQVDFSFKKHDHTRSTLDLLSPSALTKRAFNLNALQVLWGNYFGAEVDSSGAKYLLVSGTVLVNIGTAGTGGYRGLSSLIDFSPYTAGHTSNLDLDRIRALVSSWNGLSWELVSLVGSIESGSTSGGSGTAYDKAPYAPILTKSTTGGYRIFLVSATGAAMNAVIVDVIAVLRSVV